MLINTIFAWVGTDGDKSLQYLLYIAVVLILLIVSGILYLLWWLVSKYVIRRKFSKRVAIIVIMFTVLTCFFLIYILPGIVREQKWQALQAMCAEQVGYRSPDDNNNPLVSTTDTQNKYWECLEIDK